MNTVYTGPFREVVRLIIQANAKASGRVSKTRKDIPKPATVLREILPDDNQFVCSTLYNKARGGRHYTDGCISFYRF